MKGPAIALFHGNGVISTLIRWQTRGDYSHAALVRPDGTIVEAWQGDGVRSKELSDWTGIDCFEVASMTNDQWEKAITFAENQIGKGYDYWSIVRFISRRNMPENDRWFCSELVYSALTFADVHLFNRIKSSAVSPGLLSISPLLKPIQPPPDSPEGTIHEDS